MDRVKIDRSFVSRVVEDDRCAAVIVGLTKMAERLGMRITAEGVETPQQSCLLRRAGCTELQGYLFSAPMGAEEFEHLLQSEKVRDSDCDFSGA